MYTHTLFVKYLCDHQKSFRENFFFLLSFWLQTAAAVDYIMFNFDNFSISNFVWTESSHIWSKKVKLLVRKPM
jgi:hypothetical protein